MYQNRWNRIQTKNNIIPPQTTLSLMKDISYYVKETNEFDLTASSAITKLFHYIWLNTFRTEWNQQQNKNMLEHRRKNT